MVLYSTQKSSKSLITPVRIFSFFYKYITDTRLSAQLQVYANETDQGASTLKLFTNLCASDQVLGYTSFSAYLGTLASNIRIGAITGGGVQSPGVSTTRLLPCWRHPQLTFVDT